MNGRLDLPKLAAVLGMLGSDHDGEALAAALQAERMRRDAGWTWPELLLSPAPPPPLLPPHHGQTIADAIRLVLNRSDLLTDWEFEFVESISRASYPLREKQLAILERLVDKIQRAETRAA